MRKTAMRSFATATLAGLLLAAGVAQAQPRCRFPGPFARIDVPARTAAGTHINPLRIAADPFVLRRPDGYEMWFTTNDSRRRLGLARATSPDGRAWSVWRAPSGADSVTDLVLAPQPGTWDAMGVETAHVLVDADGTYRLYYTGDRPPQGSHTFAIGLATSRDGIAWTRHPAPVLEPQHAWERPICANAGNPETCRTGGVLEPSVLFDAAAGIYRMWYAALGETPGGPRTFRIGHATSSDGIAWTRRADPVFGPGPAGSWDSLWVSHVNVVADPGGGYHMFYFGSAHADYQEGAPMQRGAIGHAFSADGIAWERNPANPVIARRPGNMDAWANGGPSAMFEGDRLRVWYFASRTSAYEAEILLAEAPCP
jgi:hypothetical protein